MHLVAYSVGTMAVFLGLAAIHNATGQGEIADFIGMARRAPVVAMVMSAALLSLAGMPVFAGFPGKLFLFKAAWSQGLFWLVGLAILASLVSLYYYAKRVRRMYMRPAVEAAPIRVPKMALGVLLAGIVFLGVYPVQLMDAIQGAGDSLLSSDGVIRLLWSLD